MDRALILPASSAAPAALPALRDELRLLPAHAGADGSPAWMIQDPVANRFFRIGWADFEILARWHMASAPAIAHDVSLATTLQVAPEEVDSLAAFLRQHGLLRANAPADVDPMRQRAAASTRNFGEWLLHHYLFFRIPLVRPQDTLARWLPRLRWLFTPPMLALVCLASTMGIALVLHQWDVFASSFVDHLTWQGAAGFAMAVTFAKTLHELGHALTATRHGVRVAHMGVAMVVLFPMLYTDTGESWKLSRPRQRLAIASAGIVTELALAGIATLLWSLSADGPFRTAMFFLATTSWLLTLLVNASPFMRFDGYFILCDVLDFPNLHERAGNVARAWLRRSVLGVPEPWPEALPTHQRAWLTVFAIVTWGYRLSVFLGIAVLVYLFAFKLLGIALMVLEVAWFIVRPVHAEMKVWWSRRAEVRALRKFAALLALAVLMAVLLVPWHGGVHGAGLLRAARQHQVFAPRAGQVVLLPQRAQVGEGDLLFALAAPELRGGAQRAQALADARARELVGLAGVKDGEERRASVESERGRFEAEASVFSGEQSRLQLLAPFAGSLADVDPQLRAGVWVQPRQPLAVLIDPSSWVAEVYVAEEDVGRIQAGDHARVYAGSQAISGKVLQVDPSRTAALAWPMLDAASGGPIVTLPRAAEAAPERVVRDGLFRVRIALAEAPSRQQMALCSARIDGAPRSLLHGALDTALSVLIRESGF